MLNQYLVRNYTYTGYRGGSRIFRKGCTRLLLYLTPINHIVFFLRNTSCIRKPQVISGEGGAHPLHPPPRSAPGIAFAPPQKSYWIELLFTRKNGSGGAISLTN